MEYPIIEYKIEQIKSHPYLSDKAKEQLIQDYQNIKAELNSK